MAARTIDIKIQFEQTDMMAGPAGRVFRTNVLVHGGRSDDRGFSYADAFLRQDEGVVVGPAAGGGVAAPLAVPMPAAAAALAAATRHRRTRLKESFRYLVAHISDPVTIALLGDPAGTYFQDGPEAYDYVMGQIVIPPTTGEVRDLKLKWFQSTIIVDVGVTETTIKDTVKFLRFKNAELPPADQYSDEDIAEQLLTMIKDASNIFAVEANTELNAPEGVPGTPNVRRFQLAPPAPGVARPRDLAGMIQHFHTNWSDAVKSKRIAAQAKTGTRPAPATRQTVEAGRAAMERGLTAEAGTVLPYAPLARPPVPRLGSPSRTIPILVDAGFAIQQGTVTTTDFRLASQMELAMAAESGEGGDEFVCEVCYDADGTMSIEILCNNCRGPGHKAAVCPSPKKFRSFAYVIALNQNAQRRADDRGAELGNAPGGFRPLPRGQRQPFRQTPRRFQRPQQSSQPHRRFQPGGQRARLAEEAGEGAPPPGPEQPDTDVSSAARETGLAVQQAQLTAVAGTATVPREAGPSTPLKFALSDSGYYEESGLAAREITPTLPVVKSPALARVMPTVPPRPPRRVQLGMASAAITVAIACVAVASHAQGMAAWTARTGYDTLSTFVSWAASIVASPRAPVCVLVLSVLWLLGRACVGASEVDAPATRRGVGGESTMQQVDISNLPIDACHVVHNHSFDVMERCRLTDENSRSPDDATRFAFCFDSGATAWCLPEEDAWMVDKVTDDNPNVGLEVANGTALRVVKIGSINSDPNSPTLVLDNAFIIDEQGVEVAVAIAPKVTRALVTRGLKPGTRLAGVNPSRELDGIYSYFNDDNSLGISDCIRLTREAPNAIVRFNGSRHEVTFHEHFLGETIGLPHGAMVGVTAHARSDLTIHCGLGHVYDRRIRVSNLRVDGISLHDFTFDAALCRGCRLGKTHAPPVPRASAPSAGGPSRHLFVREPSTTQYTYFGQRIDADLSTSFSRSWPHGFTVMTNLVDRHSAEFFLYFQVQPNAAEVASALTEFETRVAHRLRGGRITRWHLDNATTFEGPEVKEAAAGLVSAQTRTVPNMHQNPVVERSFGTLEGGVRADLAFASANDCLWAWSAAALNEKLYYISTKAHNPPTSPYRFSHPDAEDVDMSPWAYPMFCDVTVHIPARDVDGKTGATGAEACNLGPDLKRNATFCYVPSLKRISSFVVTTWQPESFTACKTITADTPVEYGQVDDLRFGATTADLLPKRMRALAVDKEGAILRENARRISEGVKALDKEGAETVIQAVARTVMRNGTSTVAMERAVLAPDERMIFGAAGVGEHEIEIEILGNDIARKVAVQYGIPKIRTVAEAMESQYWPLIREAMENEIMGKVANQAWRVVKREGHRVLKSKWDITFKMDDDGTILSVKARFVACGYSQEPERDFDKTFASTLPGCCFRIWCSTVADEDLETDSIDAVKAFTQGDIDRELYVDMPIGFAIIGYCLLFLKALEGIKQGAFIWFQKNKWAWNKCGMFADIVEPNLYTHSKLVIIAAVFADDVAAGFKREVEREYLLIRAEYGKLIKIDSPGPDTVVPVTKFTGVNFDRDREHGLVKISMRSYIKKLIDRRKGTIEVCDFPTGRSKLHRLRFDELKAGEGESVDKTEYLEKLGEVAWPTTMVWWELSYYTSTLGQFMNDPRAPHMAALDTVYGYLLSDPDMPIIYGGKLKVPLGLVDYPTNFIESKGLYVVGDSSWGTRPRPQGGHLVMRTNGIVLWSSRALKIVADSTAHAETAESSRGCKSGIFVRTVLGGIGRPVVGPTALFGDNKAQYDLVAKEGSSSKSRHFERATIFVKWAIMRLMFVAHLVGTKLMLADILTKATDAETFERMRDFARNLPAGHASTRIARRALTFVKNMMRHGG